MRNHWPASRRGNEKKDVCCGKSFSVSNVAIFQLVRNCDCMIVCRNFRMCLAWRYNFVYSAFFSYKLSNLHTNRKLRLIVFKSNLFSAISVSYFDYFEIVLRRNRKLRLIVVKSKFFFGNLYFCFLLQLLWNGSHLPGYVFVNWSRCFSGRSCENDN